MKSVVPVAKIRINSYSDIVMKTEITHKVTDKLMLLEELSQKSSHSNLDSESTLNKIPVNSWIVK